MEVLGIDIGGTGIKGALVDGATGKLLSERIRHKTPGEPTPDHVFSVIEQLKQDFSWSGPVGCGFPGIVRSGIVYSAANLHPDWINFHLSEHLEKCFGHTAFSLNDADAAGLAEIAYGAGKGIHGVVLMVTVGTGIGTALFVNGNLVPNTEFGHLLIKRKGEPPITAEKWASTVARKTEDIKWSTWTERFNQVLNSYSFFLGPQRFIIGGGVVKKFEKFQEFLNLNSDAEVVPAQMGNLAGIVGAAAMAASHEA